TLRFADVDSGSVSTIDTSSYSYQEEWHPAWSPDSRWLTYSKHLHNRVRTVFIYDVEGKRTRQLTDGRTHTELPCFDANGKYLYFASSPNAGTSEFGWGVLNGILARPLVVRRLHAVVLQNDAPSPVLPNTQPNPEAKISEALSTVRVDFDDIGRRIVDLPTPARDYSTLAPAKPGRRKTRSHQDGSHDRPAGRVEADVPGGLADNARLVLRAESSRAKSHRA